MEHIVRKDNKSSESNGQGSKQKENESFARQKTNGGLGVNSVQVYNTSTKDTDQPVAAIKKGIKANTAQASIPPPPKRGTRQPPSGKGTPNIPYNNSTDKLN